MKQLITPNWRAHKRTINGLINGGWSDEQRKRMLIAFINEHGGKTIEGASSLYNEWVRFETPRDKKEKETGKALKKVLAKQQNKSLNGEKRAQEAKTPTDIMSQAEAIQQYHSRCGR